MKKFMLFVLKIWGNALKIFPRTWVRATGAWLGFLWFDVFGFRKQIVLNNLDIAFPDMDLKEKTQIGRSSVYQLGYNFAEFLTIPAMDKAWIEKNVIFEGWENLQKAKAQGKGVFLLSLHLGNGDTGANAIALRGQEIYIITKEFKTKWFNDLWFSIRGAQGVKYINAHGASNAFDILKALKKNAAIVFVLDQFMGKPYGILTRFFGKETGTAYGLALFVHKTKAPVLPIYTYEGKEGKIHVVFEPALDTTSVVTDDKDVWIAGMTQKFNDKLEEIIKKHPGQWMWVHRRWKDFE